MDFIDKVEKTVTESGREIGRKVKGLAEMARLKSMIHTCQEVIDQNYRKIGKAYFEAHSEEEGCEYAQACKAIMDAQKGIDALQEEIKNLSQ